MFDLKDEDDLLIYVKKLNRKNEIVEVIQVSEAYLLTQGEEFSNEKEYNEFNKKSLANTIVKKIKQKYEEEIELEKKKKEDRNNLIKEVMINIASKQEEKATELIVIYIENNNYIKTTADDLKAEVWFYEEGIYKPNGESKIREIVRKILKRCYTPQRVNKVIAKIQADTYIDIDEFNNNNIIDEIPIMNGILNVITRELSPFNPNKIFFNKLPLYYDPKAKCPNIDKFFKSVLKKEEDSLVLEELFGYCLYKEHFIEKAIMFVGNGRNGKGKTESLLKKFLGDKNYCAVSLSQLIPTSSGIVELHNRLANIAGDLSNTSLKDTGLFKEVTGRDSITAKRKYLRDLSFVNYSKQIFACNELPKVYDSSEGFWDRWLLFEFPYKFIDKDIYDQLSKEERINKKIKDTDIIKRIATQEEMNGLLNKALDGLLRLLKNKKFSYSKSVADVKDMWIRRSDSFEAFCIDNIEEDHNSYVLKKDVRKLFSKYTRLHKIKGCSDMAIKVRLENNYGVSEDRFNLSSFGYGYQERVWSGIRIKNHFYFNKNDGEIEICQGFQGISKTPEKVIFHASVKTPTTLTNEKKDPIIEENIDFSEI